MRVCAFILHCAWISCTCTLLQIDLPLANIAMVTEQLDNAFGFDESEILQVSSRPPLQEMFV